MADKYIDTQYTVEWEKTEVLEERKKNFFKEARKELIETTTLGDYNVFKLYPLYLNKMAEASQSIYGGEYGTFKADLHRMEALDAWMTFNGYAMPKSMVESDWSEKKTKLEAFSKVRSSFIEWLGSEALTAKSKEELTKSHKAWLEKAKQIFTEALQIEDNELVEELLNYGGGKLKPSFSDLQAEEVSPHDTSAVDVLVSVIEHQSKKNKAVGNLLVPAMRILNDKVERNLWKTWYRHEGTGSFGFGLPSTYTPFIETIMKNWKAPPKIGYPNQYPHRKEGAKLDDPNPYVEEDTLKDDRNRDIDPFYVLNEEQRHDNSLAFAKDGFFSYFNIIGDEEIEPILKRFAVVRPFSFWERVKAQAQMYDFPIDYEEVPRCAYTIEWDYLQPNPFRIIPKEEITEHKKALIEETFEDLFFEVFEATDVKVKVEKKYETFINQAQYAIDIGKEKHKDTSQKATFYRSMLLATSFQLSEKKIKQYQYRNKGTAVTSAQYDDKFYVGPLIKKRFQTNFERIKKLSEKYYSKEDMIKSGGIFIEENPSTPLPDLDFDTLVTPEVKEETPVPTITYSNDKPLAPSYGNNPMLPVNIPFIEQIKHEVRLADDAKYEEDLQELTDELYQYERETFLKKNFNEKYQFFFNYIIWYTTFRRDRPNEFSKLFSYSEAKYFDRRIVNILRKRKELYDEQKVLAVKEKEIEESDIFRGLSRTKKARKMQLIEKDYTEKELQLSLEELLNKRSALWRFTVLPVIKFVFKRPYMVSFLDNMINILFVLPPRINDAYIVPAFTFFVRITVVVLYWFRPRIIVGNRRILKLLGRLSKTLIRYVDTVLSYSLYYVFPLGRKLISIASFSLFYLKSVFGLLKLVGVPFKVFKRLAYFLVYPFAYLAQKLKFLHVLEKSYHNFRMSSFSVLISALLFGMLLLLLDEHHTVRSMGLTKQELSNSKRTLLQHSVSGIYDVSNALLSFGLDLHNKLNDSLVFLYSKSSLLQRDLSESCANRISQQFLGHSVSRVELSSSKLQLNSISVVLEEQTWEAYNKDNQKLGSVVLHIHSNLNPSVFPQPLIDVSNSYTRSLVIHSAGVSLPLFSDNKHQIVYVGVKDHSNNQYNVVFNIFDPNTYTVDK
eukprot:TRINITY_DN1706_c0_g1_i1.p1 TRINITY_DN1706_c0_g1~~TRINITY_DN1706_c0_g1_i1.p1  ORF type:complete len:1118 (+),score=366.83 TRINITY_DN1706_c0_g1_i1:1271-4624(+)